MRCVGESGDVSRLGKCASSIHLSGLLIRNSLTAKRKRIMNGQHTRLAAILFCMLTTTVLATDLTTIARSIKKEPSYQTRPRYCLLVFGQEARTRVWTVVDGCRLYIDRNGNGDLTERGEWIYSDASGRLFEVDQIREVDGTTVHKEFKLSVYDDDRVNCSIILASGGHRSVGYDRQRFVGRPQLSARPQDAPIIHFNGPMMFARLGSTPFLTRDPDGKSFRTIRVLIGTPGLGDGTFARYRCATWCGHSVTSTNASP